MPSPQILKQLIQTLLCWTKEGKRAFCHQHFVAAVAQSNFLIFIQNYNVQRNNYIKARQDSMGHITWEDKLPPFGISYKRPGRQRNSSPSLHRQHPRKRFLSEVSNALLLLDLAIQLELSLFHKDIRVFIEKSKPLAKSKYC